MSRQGWFIIIIGVAGGLWHWHTHDPSGIHREPGILAPEIPYQRDLPKDQPALRHGEFELTPLAEFRTEARLLSRLTYRFDAGADLSPLDFAIGWGRMSDSAILDQLNISQGARFFSYRWSDGPPIPADEIVRSAANVHLIPADAAVKASLRRIRPGEVIELEGLLVAASREDGWSWKSSLTREDTGAGACELLLVQRVTVVP